MSRYRILDVLVQLVEVGLLVNDHVLTAADVIPWGRPRQMILSGPSGQAGTRGWFLRDVGDASQVVQAHREVSGRAMICKALVVQTW